jgi:signal transduction histidine kinase
MTRRARVLVVDDNAAFVENLAEILEDAGYAPLTARSVASAREAAAHGFEVALVDLRLPDGDGAQLVAELKARAPESEAVLLTGFATVESAAEAVRAGACAYLMKPCSTAELLLTLEQAMRQVRLQAEKTELTRRAQTAEKLAAVGTLTAGLSHEIRNPLNAAALQLAVLDRRISRLPADIQAPLHEPLTLVGDEIRRLDRILEEFLQFARPRELQRVRVELSELVGRVLDFLDEDAQRRGIRLERAVEGPAPVDADPDRLRQVLVNLVLNALDATPEGGFVRVSLAREDAQVSLEVADSGAGIPPELTERIFEPFFTTKSAGTGLGLSVVHAIVVQHGGTLTLDASAAGGAAFQVRLPAAG